MDHILQVTTRTEQGKALNKFRKSGKVPGNIFSKHQPSIAIWVDATSLKKARQSINEGALVYLQIGDKQKHPTIMRHISVDVRNANPMHVSFQEVSLKEKVTVEIQLEFIGEAPAIKLGNVIETPITSVEISALPTNIPEKLEVDLSKLESINDRIIASEIILPKAVELVTDPDSVVVAVVEPMSAEPEAAEPVDEASAIAAVEATEEKEPKAE